MEAPPADGEPEPRSAPTSAMGGESLSAPMNAAAVPPDAIGPPDYEFGPPPGAEAPGPEASAAARGDMPGAFGPAADDLRFSAPGAAGDETAAWPHGSATPGTWISDTPGYPLDWGGQQASDVPGFSMSQEAGSTVQFPVPDAPNGHAQMAPPPLLPPVPPPGDVPGTTPGATSAAGQGAGLDTQPAPTGWPPQPPQFQPPAGAGMAGGFPGQPPFPPAGHPFAPPRRSGRKKFLTIGAAVVVLAIVAAGLVLMNRHTASPPKAAPSPSRSTPAPARLASKIDNVKTDPKPITKSEIFPDVQVSAAGRQFTRVAAVMNRNCAKSARGSFARALMADKCERVVRATYVDSTKRFAITAGVAALPTKTLATRANRAKKLKHNIWFIGLDGGKGSGAQFVSRSGGYAYGVVEGRYIIFGFASYSNGHMPTGKTHQDQVLNSLSRVFTQLAQQPITVRALG